MKRQAFLYMVLLLSLVDRDGPNIRFRPGLCQGRAKGEDVRESRNCRYADRKIQVINGTI